MIENILPDVLLPDTLKIERSISGFCNRPTLVFVPKDGDTIPVVYAYDSENERDLAFIKYAEMLFAELKPKCNHPGWY